MPGQEGPQRPSRLTLTGGALFGVGVGLGAFAISLFVLSARTADHEISGVFVPFLLGQPAFALGLFFLDLLLFSRKGGPREAPELMWAIRLMCAAAIVVIGIGLWQARWPHHLVAVLPLGMSVFLIRATRHLRPGSAAASRVREAGNGQPGH